MYYRIPAEHSENFQAFYQRLTTHAEFTSLPASTDPDAPVPDSSTALFCGDVNFQFIPRETDSVLRWGHRIVLKSRCNTMVISYRFVLDRFETTLYCGEPVKIEAIYRCFRTLITRHAGWFERTGLTLW
jgi:hypothetical protein